MTAPRADAAGQGRKAKWTNDPFIDCPACGEVFDLAGDSFEYKVGSEVTCPNCEATLECDAEAFYRDWKWIVATRSAK